MKQCRRMLALCLLLTILCGCGSDPVQTTAPAATTPAATLPPETTVPPTEPAPGSDKFRLELPEGYVLGAEQSDRYTYLSPDAPGDNSTVLVEILPLDESVLTMGTASYKKRIDVTKTEGSDALRFKLIDMWDDTVDGYKTVVSEYNLVYEDYISHIFRYEVVTDWANMIFTFTDNTDDNVWLDQFVDCVSTIRLIPNIDGLELDFSDLAIYDLDCGLRIFAQPGLREHEAEGFNDCLGNRDLIILFMADNKQTNHLTDMNLEDYAQLLRQTNDLRSFQRDLYDNLYTSFYTNDDSGAGYFNMIFLKETEEAFWVCQMACTAENQGRYEKEFPRWAASIMD